MVSEKTKFEIEMLLVQLYDKGIDNAMDTHDGIISYTPNANEYYGEVYDTIIKLIKNDLDEQQKFI